MICSCERGKKSRLRQRANRDRICCAHRFTISKQARQIALAVAERRYGRAGRAQSSLLTQKVFNSWLGRGTEVKDTHPWMNLNGCAASGDGKLDPRFQSAQQKVSIVRTDPGFSPQLPSRICSTCARRSERANVKY